ncbi:MAG: efflux RND transporter periplasmic adaptor subunit [Ignavibacteriales bacterium]|nr:efflux RND transporter periplasmic adaptor subunit [Ignavibacteriales bacterium]MCF8307061.1 efflux RND transporter periplasmic adaptor subunit [Ignavibacteriales bacterium]MCF8316684.1 efflux RND transporter periplasmic adaptor subunit [Ignavibacteriales bacterium]MCF8438359.1 efflux RND transporter periplasmic adaptor subunit [Ignavibacteriales bacterium]
MKNRIKYLVIVSIFSLFVFAGCSGETEEKEEIIVPVKIYKVQPESLTQYLKLTGNISAGKDQVIYSKISERIDALNVKPGDRVVKNQVIARQYNTLFAKGVDAAKANAANAEAQLALAEQNFRRMERLYAQKAISSQQFDQSQTQFKAASAGLDAAKAQLQQAEEQLDNCEIKAPFAGVAAVVYVENNQMLPAGQPVAQIIDPSIMKSKMRAASRDIYNIKLGQKIDVSIPSVPAKKYAGKITSIDQAIDPVSKTLELEALITDADQYIKSGMYAEFMIPTISVSNSMIIPETALISQTEASINKSTGLQETLKKYFLFVVDNEKADLKEVKVGLIADGRAQITDGINLNESVIVVGNNIVREGQKVNIID